MTLAHLPHQKLLQLVKLCVDLGLWEFDTQKQLLLGFSPQFRSVMPQTASNPRDRLAETLNFLNYTERLRDGSVPLVIWLQNAVTRAPETGEAQILRDILDDVAIGAAGSKPPDLQAIPELKEAILFEDNLLPVEFLRGGAQALSAVAKLVVPRFHAGSAQGAKPTNYRGTAWLLTPTLIATNHHIINARSLGEADAGPAELDEQAAHATAWFDQDNDGVDGTGIQVRELCAAEPVLDYAVLRLAGPLPARNQPLRVRKSAFAVTSQQRVPVNIIQHPDGLYKMVGCRDNLVIRTADADVYYLTDTRQGSSGSPVCDDYWRVVAIHRCSKRENVSYRGRGSAYVNCGTAIVSVLADLRTRASKIYEEVMDFQN